MCGIAGIFAYSDSGSVVDREALLRMREHMANRGPDGAGLWLHGQGRVGLAHRRLAILDLGEGGAQPMATADGRLRIVFNGEIYNHRELRERLKARGHVFASHSDTEVLLHAYREYGQDMVTHLRGMFAFALWDEDKQGLFLARDHFGIKPLYYYDDGKTFRLASQVKALLAGGVETQVEPAGRVGFYLWGNVPEPYTLYRDLLALPAGHSLWLDRHGPRAPRRYFDVAEELGLAAEARVDDAQAALGDALRDSVAQHLIADVPVGLFLSSGLDSTTVAAIASEGSDKPRAITLGFDEFKGSARDEVPLARIAAAHCGCEHHVEFIARRDFDEALPALLQAMDQPSIDGINTYFVARAAHRAGLKAALSGVGGDELLGGYPSFRQIPGLVSGVRPLAALPGLGRFMRLLSAPWLSRFTSPKYAGLLEYGGSYGGAYLLRRGLYMPWELPRFLDGELVKEGWAKLQPVSSLDAWLQPVASGHARVAAMEMSVYMCNMLLRDADWAGMAHGLEIRTPMVDIDLFRALAPFIASSRPPTKAMLGVVPSRTLPPAILDRPKTGFAVPMREWLDEKTKGGLRGWSKVVCGD